MSLVQKFEFLLHFCLVYLALNKVMKWKPNEFSRSMIAKLNLPVFLEYCRNYILAAAFCKFFREYFCYFSSPTLCLSRQFYFLICSNDSAKVKTIYILFLPAGGTLQDDKCGVIQALSHVLNCCFILHTHIGGNVLLLSFKLLDSFLQEC